MQLALFIIFGALAVAGALNLLLQRHPINSALSLVVVMMSLAVLYWSLGAEFLAAAQVIVYSGAIMVFFVFVIMLLNAGEEERTKGSRAAYFVGFPGAAAIFCLLSFVNLTFVAFAHMWHQVLGQQALQGQIFVFFVMVVAAAEAAVGLAIIIAIFRTRETLNVDSVDLMKS